MENSFGSQMAQQGLAFLIGTLDPVGQQVAPPNLGDQSSFSKAITGTGLFPVGNDLALIGEQVPTQSGMMLWLPQRGVLSMYHMGFVPQGSTVLTAGGGISTRGLYGGPWNLQGTAATKTVASLTYIGTLAIPYSHTGKDSQVTLAPSLAGDFSSTKAYSGILTVTMDAVGIGATALTGEISAAAISDTRNVSQINTAGVIGSYSVVDLGQQAVTQQDSLRLESAMDGAVALVGSDFAKIFTNPDSDRVFNRQGAFQQYTYPAVTIPNYAFFASWPAVDVNRTTNIPTVLFHQWITPWQIQLAAPAGQPAITQNIVGPIDEAGTLDIAVHFGMNFNNPSTPAPHLVYGDMFHVIVTATHVFGACSSDGSISYTELSQQGPILELVTAPPSAALVFQYDDTFNGTEQRRVSMAATGKYLGTYLAAIVTIKSQVDPGNGAIITGFNVNAISTSVLAPTINSPGACGPARVIRWDSVTAGQLVKASALLNVQVVPQGAIAPYTQQAAATIDQIGNVNIIPWIQRLYNGSHGLRRILTKTHYDDFLRNILPQLSAEKIAGWAQRDDSLATASHAAGIFGSLGGTLAGPLGGILGGLADGIFGSAGQFGACGGDGDYGAAGQFGAAGKFGAAGQFGSAGSMMGGSRRQRG